MAYFFAGFFFVSSLPHFFLPAKLFLAKKIIIIQKKKLLIASLNGNLRFRSVSLVHYCS